MSVPFPLVDVSAVVITNATGELLLTYNNHWNCFTLPLSKRRDLPPKMPTDAIVTETGRDAAVRAAVEVLGVPINPLSLTEMNVTTDPWHQSARDGSWKRYSYTVFTLKTTMTPRPLPGHAAVWVKPSDLATLAPISPTYATVLTAVPSR